MNSIQISGILITICLFLASCAQHAITRIESVQAPCPRTISRENDTLSYTVAFNDSTERGNFILSFNQFLKKYPFMNVLEDTVGNFVRIHILPATSNDTVYQPITRIEQANIIEDVIEETITAINSDSALAVTDSVLPQYGGTVKLYFPRKTLDPVFSRFFNIFPFRISDTLQQPEPILSLSDSSQRRITLKMNNKITNAEKRTLSALDFIDIWTSILKKHPAEGYALFRNVSGITEFISGNEATVRGFSAVDENTITLRLSVPDTLAVSRLQSRRLMDDRFKLGPYQISRRNDTEIELNANVLCTPDKPFLDNVILHTGGDPNPILSFSLNKYDAVVLTSINDLDYARKNLSKNASLIEIPGERYFLSCASTDEQFKMFVKNQINAADMLRNQVKAEGAPIKAVAIDDLEFAETEQTHLDFIPGNKSYKVIYCEDDPISKIIAEKLLATLSHAKINTDMTALNSFDYERCLITRNYDCAVGWVPQNITHNKSEQLRLASIWFNDESDILKRLQSNHEIPLFSIKRYLLMKNDLHLRNNSVQGIFWKTAKSESQQLLEN